MPKNENDDAIKFMQTQKPERHTQKIVHMKKQTNKVERTNNNKIAK